MYVGKSRAYTGETQIIYWAWKACKGQTLAYYERLINYSRKKFYNIGPWMGNKKSFLKNMIVTYPCLVKFVTSLSFN